ncbi:MAG TPA: fimbria/pilus periplasmic chaperone [Thermoanaerobaculia bacterium]|nr:fimbria/pilus periplasmic chaperone [Thermoanaerobaculia bacterium]
MNFTFLLRFLFLLGLALGQAELFAGNFRLSPVQVFLGDGSGSALITVYNESDQPIRFQITASAWSQSESGEMLLEPTEDLLFFPKLLEIAPGAQRNVRVGSTARAGESEKTYRLFFDELPPAPVPGEGAKVTVVTKMGVPVFITPRGASPDVEVEGTVSGGKVAIALENSGTSHVSLQGILVTGVSAAGTETFSRRLDGWYLLARSRRSYEVELNAEECSATERITVEAGFTRPDQAEQGKENVTLMRAPGDSCSPPGSTS